MFRSLVIIGDDNIEMVQMVFIRTKYGFYKTKETKEAW